MANRGQKRTEAVDEWPADKRACSSSEFRPSTSNSSAQTPMSSAHDADMDTSSSTSGSTRSEGDGEKDSTYGSCDSDSSIRDYYRRRSWGDQSKFKKVLSSLSEEVEESGQLAALTELCELLSFATDSSLPSLMADSFSPILVKLARQDSNPDIMLLATRAITYLCDVNPRSSGFLIRHNAVPVLCQKLMVIEYLDVAEQCLQALEKISREQPLACSQSGAVMAVLNYIDFFSTSMQRVALSTVVNICKKPTSECPLPFMEAIPILCNLLQYEDTQLVESVATCLIKIGEQVCHSSDMLDEVSRHGVIQQALHHIDLNSRTTLGQPIYVGLIGLLVKLASGSAVAFRTLLELNISSILKDILSTYDLSHGMLSTSVVDGHCSQIHEVLKLLNELLPTIAREQDIEVQLSSDKESFLMERPNIVEKFGIDLLPVLIQVVHSGMDMYICYGCLSIINKLVYLSKSEVLLTLLQTANFSSFLAGVFTRKDPHVILLALQIVDTVLLKLPHVFLKAFTKEGVLFTIYGLFSPDMCSQFTSPVFDGRRFAKGESQKSAPPDIQRCPCFTFDAGQSSKSPETGSCKLQKDAVQNLAKHIWTNHFSVESPNPEKGLTDILQKLRTLSTALTAMLSKSLNDVAPTEEEDEIYNLLHQIMLDLNGKDPISTFEFVESGIMKALVNYLTNGQHLGDKADTGAVDQLYIIEKRFEVFGRLLLSFSVPSLEEFPLLTLVRRLQSALSSVENFPVILSHTTRLRNSYATVPYGRCNSYPCLKIQFVKEEEDIGLRDYTESIVNVDPFVPLDAIEGYLWPKLNSKTEDLKSSSHALKEKGSSSSHSPSDSNFCKGKSPDLMASSNMLVYEEKPDLPLSSPEGTTSFEQRTVGKGNVTDVHTEPVEKEKHCPLEEDGSTNTDHPGGASPKLLFYLEGKQLDSTLSLYQSILKRQLEVELDTITSAKLWNRVYKITYRRAVKSKQSYAEHRHNVAQSSLARRVSVCNYAPFFSGMLVPEVDVERSSAACDVLSLLKSLEGINRFRFHLMYCERILAFAEGRTDSFDILNVAVHGVSQNEFANSKLTEKLEQQIRDPMAVSVGGMPSWCTQLMTWYPFLFGFEARCKYFRLVALGRSPFQNHTVSHSNMGVSSGRQHNNGNFPRKKFLVHRDKILDSAAQMMDLYAHQKVVLEVEYNEEVGTGLGPTLEFYTMVCHEFQKSGLGMWRDDHISLDCMKSSEAEDSKFLVSHFGLFPRPWSSSPSTSSGIEFSEVIKKFVLLGQIVAKSLHDGRVLDLPFSKAFYKLILGKELTMYDIQLFDPGLGRALLEFCALVERKRYLESLCEEKSCKLDLCFRNTRIEDLCLDFTLPGYPDYALISASDLKMVNLYNLEEYVSFIVDATVKSGISRQVEAFKSGFDQVFPIRHLEVFTEDELECLLCGEHELWKSTELLDNIKFDHGYTVSSPPVVNLLEIMQEFDNEQQRAFLQFVTGAPRLPTGGLASLNPKLTIVRKHCSKRVDDDLPSVMTCANYLKLPPYSSKEIMKEKLLYAITEGQGSFHLS
ncbi:E3 ubiquitin-protein ligase [Forsythia ovata]|uniref:HECT-type E3 ubiquitin transferase n=1 Tax=Forsythia ovata TaxID=205694 RepID=A0ABD1X0L8_9LAMI